MRSLRLPPIAEHPLTQPIRSLEQARAALRSDNAWGLVSSARFQPDAEALEGKTESDLWAWAAERRCERLAYLLWHDRTQWTTFPELGFPFALGVATCQATYQFNGPDEPAQLNLGRFTFAPGLTREQEREAADVFRKITDTRWSEEVPDSPMRGLLQLVANRKPQSLVLDLTSFEALRAGICLPEHLARWRADELEAGWEHAPLAPSGARRPRL